MGGSNLPRPARYRSETGLETPRREAPSAPPLGELLSKAKLRGCRPLDGSSFRNCPLASPGGVAERSESFKIMIACGNHTEIKKLS